MDNKSSGLKNLIFDAHRRAILPWLVERTDLILVSSKEYAETCSLSSINGAAEKIKILSFGVDLERFRPGSDQIFRDALDISEDTPILLFVGGLDRAHYFKGLSVLLDALGELKESPWQLLVIGDGDLRESYMVQTRLLDLSHRVKFLGSLSEEEKPRAFRASDIHVFPSVDRSEAFGLVALEAAASGLPCIASDLPGVRSVVKDGETGLLVKPESVIELRVAIKRLLDNPENGRRLGQTARLRAEQEFAWDPLIDKLEKEYENRCHH